MNEFRIAETADTGEAIACLADLMRLVCAGPAHAGGQFEDVYAGRTPPWDIGRPQPCLARFVEDNELAGRVLDVGCGTGEHALMAAHLGLQAVGIDIAPSAIDIARRKAADRGLKADFEVRSALAMAELGDQFDVVIDSGLFHLFSDADRASYVDNLATVLQPGGQFILLCFSDRQPGEFGPRRVREEEIRTSFARGWTVKAIDAVTMEISTAPSGAKAWRACLVRS